VAATNNKDDAYDYDIYRMDFQMGIILKLGAIVLSRLGDKAFDCAYFPAQVGCHSRTGKASL
jgi:hypothetical protein